MSFKAQFMENFVSADDNSGSENLNSSMVIPPPTVSDQAERAISRRHLDFDLYLIAAFSKYPWDAYHGFQGYLDVKVQRVQVTDSAYGGNKTSGAIKGAPLESLFAQFCLHSLWLGYCNIRAIAVLWIEFVREVRRCWEESQLIPRMPANGPIDLSTCLINQKLQMLAVCIEKKCEVNEDYQDCIGSEDQIESMTEEESVVGDDSFKMRISCGDFYGNVDSFPTAGDIHYSAFSGKPSDGDDKKPSDITMRGSANIADSMMLLKSNESMHAPYTQEAPLMTEDKHEECPQDVEDFSDSFNFSTLVERETLASGNCNMAV
ncbi:hypothetical protein V8G54_036355 [Vigna mungo]|uniref:Rab3 GTPase-activating protein catalytic subunit n=1 Tax=Vigna mungo TaxID=3915 RepID=A0AAQ3MGK7_VIGMU